MSLKTSIRSIVLIICGTLAGTMVGCKAVQFKKPELPSLAFWKKQDDALPPPPARHFDPARFNAGENERQVAASRGEFGVEKSGSAEASRSAEGSGTKNGGSGTSQPVRTASSEGSSTKPSRKLYGMDDFADDVGEVGRQAANSFELNTGEFKSRVDSSLNGLGTEATGAQQQFAAAMKSRVEDFSDTVANASNALSSG